MGNAHSSLPASISLQQRQSSGTIVTINPKVGQLTQKTMSDQVPSTNQNSSPTLESTSRDVSMADIDSQQLEYGSRHCSEQYIENAGQQSSTSSSICSAQPNGMQALPSDQKRGTETPRKDSSMILYDDGDQDETKSITSEESMAVDESCSRVNSFHSGATLRKLPSVRDDNQRVDVVTDSRQQQLQQPMPQQLQQQQQQQQQQASPPPPLQQQNAQPILVPTIFKWTEGGHKVFVMGTFTAWRKMIALNGPSPKDGSFSVQIALPPGMHRFKFVVDNEVKCSNFIPTATDNSGHFVNYLEIIPSERELYPSRHNSSVSIKSTGSKLGLTRDDDDMGNGYTRYHEEKKPSAHRRIEYTNVIPPIFTDPKVMEEYYVTLDNSQRNGGHNQQWLIPPQLPPHLENVILNSYNSNDKENTSGALSIPNHVVLNHLATTSIRHNTLAVASVVRYKRKYVTQILYAPLSDETER